MPQTIERFVLVLPALLSGAALFTGCSESAPAPGSGPGTDPKSAAPTAGSVVFVDATAEAGLDFALDRSVAGDYFMPDSMGTGCGLFDYDGDGDLDLYLVNGFRDENEAIVTPAGANRLYRQEADGRFIDATEEAGVGHRGYGMGVATGDIDNDGDVDLFVTNYGPNCLYRNDGDGTFTEISQAAHVEGGGNDWSASAGFFDYDGDGFLDLFVTNYLAYEASLRASDASGRRDYPAPGAFPGVADILYHNDGDGTFTDVSVAAGIAGRATRGLGVVFADLNGDHRPDIYVANDGEANIAWINGPEYVFTDEALFMGLAVNAYGVPEASMGLGHADVDGDGDADLFATHLVRESNTLYRQTAPGIYEDATMPAALAASSIDRTGFGTAFVDCELDGDLDIVVTNGRIIRAEPHPGAKLNAHWRPYAEPDQLLLNDGTGRFSDAGPRAGALAANVEVGRGLAVGDVDGDGDLDVVIANGNGTLRLYRNEAPREGNWLTVRVVDPALRRDALGAVVLVRVGARVFRREVTATESYLSSRDPRSHIGLGPADAYDEIVVVWPDGIEERFPGGAANRIVELRRGE